MKNTDPKSNQPVNVYNQDGNSMISTTRASRARRLLQNKKAVVHTRNPFSIRLLSNNSPATVTTQSDAIKLKGAGDAANSPEYDNPRAPEPQCDKSSSEGNGILAHENELTMH